MKEARDTFRMYFDEPVFVDRYERQPELGVDVVIPVLHTNELWRNNLLSIYREIPVRRLLLGNAGCIDDTLTVASAFPRVHVFDHTKFHSLGFSLRRLIEEVETDWFIYLHSDVYLSEGWFDAMSKERLRYDWFESNQYTTVIARYLSQYATRKRAYSGAQMGSRAAFREVLPLIDDDYLYRNEDIIIARLIEKKGFRYGKVEEAFIHHQQMFKESPWLRRVKKVNSEVELGHDEEVRAGTTFVKGIVKYLKPEDSEDLIRSMRTHLARLEQMGAMSGSEFASWVSENGPEWSEIFPLGLAGMENKGERSLRDRLRWASSRALRKLSRVSDRLATRLAPESNNK